MQENKIHSSISPVAAEDMYLLEILLDANQIINGWQLFLDSYRKHFNLDYCHIHMSDKESNPPIFQSTSQVHLSDWNNNEYLDSFFQTDALHLPFLQESPHQWLASNLQPNREELESMQIFTEWALPNGMAYIAGSSLFKDHNWHCIFLHSKGPMHSEYTHNELLRHQSLSPYIEKALKLSLQLNTLEKDKVRLRAICNQFRLPTAILNEQGVVVCMNGIMETLTNSSNTISITANNHLNLIHDKYENEQLQVNIATALSASQGKELTRNTSSLSLQINNTGYILGTRPITSLSGSASEEFHGAIIYVASLDNINTTSVKNLKRLFQLTEAEANVCQLFSLGKNLKEIALHENKSLHTVKEQLQNSYKKTKTNGQLELINLIASLPVH